jgi:hypothetical protein
MKTAHLAILSLLALAGCSASTPPPNIQASRNPANPAIGGYTPVRSNVVQGYTHRTPVEPQGWEEPAHQPPAAESGS